MKVLYLTPGCFDKGGISRYNRYQINALQELCGLENVGVLSLLGPDEDQFEEPFKVHWHGNKYFQWSKLGILYHLVKQLILFKPDYIWIGHVNFSGFCWILSKIFSPKTKTVLNVYGLEVWSGLTWDAGIGLKNVDHVISDCHNTAEYIGENNLRPKGSIEVIWDCVDLDKFKPIDEITSGIISKYKLPSKDNNFIILTLGRISKEAAHKGYERLLIVFSKLVKTNPEAHLVFAGKGNMVDFLKQETIKLKIQDKVSFTGMVHDNDLAALYSYADIFSLVSDVAEGRGEGIPLTPLEAMACGTPIIVGNQDGSLEAIIENKNGRAIDPFNLTQHEIIIKEMINNTELYEEIKLNTRIVAEKYFSYQDFKLKHSKFLEAVDKSI